VNRETPFQELVPQQATISSSYKIFLLSFLFVKSHESDEVLQSRDAFCEYDQIKQILSKQSRFGKTGNIVNCLQMFIMKGERYEK